MTKSADFRWWALSLALTLTSLPVYADHAWGNYHWARGSNPVSLELGDNVGWAWTGHLEKAKSDWNNPPSDTTVSKVIDTTVVPGSTSSRRCRAQKGNVQVCSDAYGNNGWLGIAGIAISGNHITAAYVKVNDTYYNQVFYNTPGWRQFVMCQEIGHTFGLGHVNEIFAGDNTGSCMDYTDDPSRVGIDGSDNTEPNLHDFQMLTDIYLDHTDGGGGGEDTGGCNPRSPKCDSGVSAADILSGIPDNGLSGWGRLVSKHGPQEIYEVKLGRGQRIITHVTWTLEKAHDHEHSH